MAMINKQIGDAQKRLELATLLREYKRQSMRRLATMDKLFSAIDACCMKHELERIEKVGIEAAALECGESAIERAIDVAVRMLLLSITQRGVEMNPEYASMRDEIELIDPPLGTPEEEARRLELLRSTQ
jgi:hypothetical protein